MIEDRLMKVCICDACNTLWIPLEKNRINPEKIITCPKHTCRSKKWNKGKINTNINNQTTNTT